METATSLVIIQLSDYLRGLTQRLDPGAGWYGEFLHRDPDGMRACLDGRAMAPWDVVESLLADLAVARGAEFAERESAYAARLRAAAVTAWDRLPGGDAELRTLLAASAAQRADSEAALRHLAERLSSTTDPAEAEALSRELAWTRDDATRATSRQADLTSRLAAVSPPGEAAPAPAAPAAPGSPPGSDRPGPAAPGTPGPVGAGPWVPGHARPEGEPLEAVPRQRAPEVGERPVGRAEGRWLRGGRRSGGARYAGSAAPEPPAFTPPPGAGTPAPYLAPSGARFGRTGPERGAPAASPRPPERTPHQPPPTTRHRPAPEDFPGNPAGARAGSAEPRAARYPEAPAAGPAGLGESPPDDFPRAPSTRGPAGARVGQSTPVPGGFPGDPAAVRAGSGEPGTGRYAEDEAGRPPGQGEPAAGGFPGGSAGGSAGGSPQGVVEALLVLRAQHRTGEAHALLCEAAAWPAGRLPALAAELNRAGLAADWATLLWEAASLPPERLAAAAAALGGAGREADCDGLLRQGAARPAAEIADAALALGAAGRDREAQTLLGAYVRLHTAEESAALARHDPQWFTPRLLDAARALSRTHHRDLSHALRVSGVAVP
ncbi:hypothetical protein [Streptomyces sp. NPDC059072]|uniref:hypothetical protein n=1 Tax=Streptomyces sp. NPDC059072 TaxID=3346715 RepID=UPI00368F6A30